MLYENWNESGSLNDCKQGSLSRGLGATPAPKLPLIDPPFLWN